jgi:signal transduction histidine kinase
LQHKVQQHKNITKAVVGAQEKERAEIGADLHDNVNQLLAASKLYLGHGLTQAEGAPFILQGIEYLNSAMDEVRKLSHALVGPSQDENIGLIESVEELVKNISMVKDIKIRFDHCCFNEEEYEGALKIVIYRIIQEQMNNILKYAAATDAAIELRKESGDLFLHINDNGKGFDTTTIRHGIGLKNISNRAFIYNGTVEILSSPGNGCKMNIVFKPGCNGNT